MPIITISRGSYSRGKEVAEALAEKLNYQCISRDILVEASEQFNIPEIKLVKALHDAPSVLERFHHGQDHYIAYFKSAFLSHMAQGNIVYHGLAGHFFLQDISHVLKIRINAKMTDRVNEEVKREKCSVADALYNLKKDDEERRRWSLQLYGKDTKDSSLYDMVLCVDSLSVDDIVEMLANVVQKRQFQETEKSLAELQKRALVANVNAVVSRVSPQSKVELLSNSSIKLSNIDGRLKHDIEMRQDLKRNLKKECNIKDVEYSEHIKPYNGHINPFYNINVH